MYFDYYELKRPPFRVTPEINSFYTGADRGATLRALMYSISHGDAIVKLVGEVGSGKTMICRMLELKLPDNIDIVYLGNPRLSPDNILQAIAFELEIPISNHESASRIMMLKSLQEHLLNKHMQGRQVVVFVEEAQCMPLETLEEIRLLSNLETQQSKLLQVVLFGQPELDYNLSSNHVRQIKDRISNSFYLPSLNKNDVSDYLQFKLYTAGYKGQHLFTRSAVNYIFKASKGLMRRINILADKALLAAYTQGSPIVTKKHISSAVMDSDFITKKQKLGSIFISSAAALALVVIMAIFIHTFSDKQADVAEKTLPIKMLKHTPGSLGLNNLKNANPNVEAILEERYKNTKKWIKQVSLSNFSIQVLLIDADSPDRLNYFFNQEGITDIMQHLYIVVLHVNGKKKLGVLYKDFSTFTDAQRALKNLPGTLRQHGPSIRYLKTVLTESFSTADSSRRD